ncbi:hypothetical protein CLOM_g24000 [Closterium sp. NIES-68]|nr:hypothetical protein CLOM_g24000 [Closterium sp. NIES-68]GJP78782.1 hypothetical protein CLOP_g9055 [Closterium sp. NIES-67]
MGCASSAPSANTAAAESGNGAAEGQAEEWALCGCGGDGRAKVGKVRAQAGGEKRRRARGGEAQKGEAMRGGSAVRAERKTDAMRSGGGRDEGREADEGSIASKGRAEGDLNGAECCSDVGRGREGRNTGGSLKQSEQASAAAGVLAATSVQGTSPPTRSVTPPPRPTQPAESVTNLPSPARMGVRSFEVAAAVLRAAVVRQSLVAEDVDELRREVVASDGIAFLLSSDFNHVWQIAAQDKWEELGRLAASVARLGLQCADSPLHSLAHHFSSLAGAGGGEQQRGGGEAEDEAMDELLLQMEEDAQITMELRREVLLLEAMRRSTDAAGSGDADSAGDPGADASARGEVVVELRAQVQRVREMQESSLWTQPLDELVRHLARIVAYLVRLVSATFGPLPRGVSFLPVAGRGGQAEGGRKLGESGMALAYARLIIAIDLLVGMQGTESRRDYLYSLLPCSLRGKLKGALLQSQHICMESTESIEEKLEGVLDWLVTMADNTIRYASDVRVRGGSALSRLQTLQHVDEARMERLVLLLLIGLQHLASRQQPSHHPDHYHDPANTHHPGNCAAHAQVSGESDGEGGCRAASRGPSGKYTMAGGSCGREAAGGGGAAAGGGGGRGKGRASQARLWHPIPCTAIRAPCPPPPAPTSAELAADLASDVAASNGNSAAVDTASSRGEAQAAVSLAAAAALAITSEAAARGDVGSAEARREGMAAVEARGGESACEGEGEGWLSFIDDRLPDCSHAVPPIDLHAAALSAYSLSSPHSPSDPPSPCPLPVSGPLSARSSCSRGSQAGSPAAVAWSGGVRRTGSAEGGREGEGEEEWNEILGHLSSVARSSGALGGGTGGVAGEGEGGGAAESGVVMGSESVGSVSSGRRECSVPQSVPEEEEEGEDAEDKDKEGRGEREEQEEQAGSTIHTDRGKAAAAGESAGVPPLAESSSCTAPPLPLPPPQPSVPGSSSPTSAPAPLPSHQPSDPSALVSLAHALMPASAAAPPPANTLLPAAVAAAAGGESDAAPTSVLGSAPHGMAAGGPVARAQGGAARGSWKSKSQPLERLAARMKQRQQRAAGQMQGPGVVDTAGMGVTEGCPPGQVRGLARRRSFSRTLSRLQQHQADSFTALPAAAADPNASPHVRMLRRAFTPNPHTPGSSHSGGLEARMGRGIGGEWEDVDVDMEEVDIDRIGDARPDMDISALSPLLMRSPSFGRQQFWML